MNILMSERTLVKQVVIEMAMTSLVAKRVRKGLTSLVAKRVKLIKVSSVGARVSVQITLSKDVENYVTIVITCFVAIILGG